MKTHTLTLTEEQIDKYGLRELVPFTGWVKTKDCDTWIGYFENNELKYCISSKGAWFDNAEAVFDTDCDRPATHEEIETGLIGMAERLGFKIGVKTKNGVIQKGYKYEYRDSENWFYYENIKVFDKGKWAEITKQPLTLEQRIERIEKELNLHSNK